MSPVGQPDKTAHPALYLQSTVTPLTEDEKKGLERTKWFLEEGSGYRAEQSTKPVSYISGRLDQRHTDKLIANPSILPPRLPSRPPLLDLREIARLDRFLPLDSRRNLHLDFHLLVQYRRARRRFAYLLRSHAQQR
jgi:hypothetical protein